MSNFKPLFHPCRLRKFFCFSMWTPLMEGSDKLIIQTRRCKLCGEIMTRQKPKLNGIDVDEINKALDGVQEVDGEC